MKTMKRIIAFVILFALCVVNTKTVADASVYDDFFAYRSGDKLYYKSDIIKGKKHFTKYTAKNNADATLYQIEKISKNKITLRPQKGWYLSDDPYFKKKTVTYKLSSECKFYYRDVIFPYAKSKGLAYKRIKKKNVLKYMKENPRGYGKIYDNNDIPIGNYYHGSYFGDVYVKNGKVVAILMDGGD